MRSRLRISLSMLNGIFYISILRTAFLQLTKRTLVNIHLINRENGIETRQLYSHLRKIHRLIFFLSGNKHPNHILIRSKLCTIKREEIGGNRT